MRRLRAVAAIVGLLCGLAGVFYHAARAQSRPVPLEDYFKLAGTTRLEVKTLSDLPDAEAGIRLETIAQRWEAIRSVRQPDGSLVSVDHRELAALLRSKPPDLDAIAERLDALAKAGSAWQKLNFAAADFEKLQGVLSRPEFRWETPQPSPLQRFWERALQWIADLLERLFGERRLPTRTPLIRWLLPGLGAALVLAVLVYIFREVQRSVAGEAALEAETGDEAEVATSNGALQRARELSQGGDMRSAVRYLFLSALLLLDERGRIHYDRTKTNRETLRSLKDQPELSAQLGEMVDIFDRVWYGYQPLEAPAFEQFVRRVESLREAR